MPQEELTTGRPSNYSQWHRLNLPWWCYMTDGDWFEQRKRNGKLVSVAYIETIQVPDIDQWSEYEPWPSKIALGMEIETKMGIPSYIVWHSPECTKFIVKRHLTSQWKKMDGKMYKEWIQKLGIKSHDQ